ENDNNKIQHYQGQIKHLTDLLNNSIKKNEMLLNQYNIEKMQHQKTLLQLNNLNQRLSQQQLMIQKLELLINRNNTYSADIELNSTNYFDDKNSVIYQQYKSHDCYRNNENMSIGVDTFNQINN